MVVEADAGAEGAVAEGGDFPAAGVGDVGDQAADPQALEAAADGGSVTAALVGVFLVLLEETTEVGVAKAA